MNYLISPFIALGTLLIIFSTIIINNSETKKFNSISNKAFIKKIDDEINPLCIKNKSIDNSLDKSKYIENISIDIPNSRGWNKNILEAYISPNQKITSKYKKRFNAQINWNQKNGYTCKFDARIRISGDLRDHINLNDSIASLDVSLKEGNLNGYVKFKLLLPNSRNGNSEIFTSLLMKELGYISPRTHFINLNVNGKYYKAIAQEKPAKEMLEYNKRRESAILEINEEVFWNKLFNDNQWNSPKIINKNWLKKNNLNIEIGIDAVNLLSLATNEANIYPPNGRDFKDEILSGFKKDEDKNLSIYRAILLANGAKHGLGDTSRQFYYNPLKKSLEPVYYDGDSRIMISEWQKTSLENDKVIEFGMRDLTLDDIYLSKKKINSINRKNFAKELNKSGLKINLRETNQKLEILNLKLNELEKLLKNKKKDIKFLKNSIEKFDVEGYGRIYYYKKNIFKICEKDLEDCKKIKVENNDTLYSILGGKYSLKNKIYLYSGFSPKFNNKNELLESAYKEKLTINNVSVLISGKPKLDIDRNRKILKIKLFNIEDKVIFMDGNLSDWDIIIDAKKAENLDPKSRYDKSLITGSINFFDMKINSLRIKMNGGLNEDSINFVRSFGQIEELNVLNSYQDAIDLDFSTLSINKIFVNNAGNDCLDLSSGNYSIENFLLSNCRDKAISLGERGVLNLEQGKILNSFSALVVKDSSRMFAKNIETNNVKNCYLVYRKKQEFGNSSLNLKNFSCKNGIKYIQENSIINTNS